MDAPLGILLGIQQLLPALTGNNRVIAEQILQAPREVLQERLSDLARRCHCDPSQIVRLCQRLGVPGFSELKNRLVAELLTPPDLLQHQMVEAKGGFSQLKRGLAQRLDHSIHATLAHLEEKDVHAAIEKIGKARTILIGAVGSSAHAAYDLQIKLHRFGYPALFVADPEVTAAICATLTQNDLLIAISFSGETPSLLELVRLAQANRLPVVALTNYLHSRLAQAADIVLPTLADEEKLRLGAMDSIIVQHLVVTVLAYALAGRKPRQTEKRIRRIFSQTATKNAKTPG